METHAETFEAKVKHRTRIKRNYYRERMPTRGSRPSQALPAFPKPRLFANYPNPPFEYRFGVPSPSRAVSPQRAALLSLIQRGSSRAEAQHQLAASGLSEADIGAVFSYEGLAFPQEA